MTDIHNYRFIPRNTYQGDNKEYFWSNIIYRFFNASYGLLFSQKILSRLVLIRKMQKYNFVFFPYLPYIICTRHNFIKYLFVLKLNTGSESATDGRSHPRTHERTSCFHYTITNKVAQGWGATSSFG